MSVCYCFCYCYYEWGNRSETLSNNGELHEFQEIGVIPPSDDEDAGASRRLISGLRDSTSDGNEDISIQSNSAGDTSEVVVVIKGSNTEDNSEGTFGIDIDNTSNISSGSDIQSKSEATAGNENTSNDGSEQCSIQDDDCGVPNVAGNSKTEGASGSKVGRISKAKKTTHK